MPNQYKNKVIYGDSVLMDITDTTAEAGDVAAGDVFYAKSGARTVGTAKYASSQSVGGPADKTIAIPTGKVDSTSTSTAFTATVDGITELRDGVCVMLTNGVVTSAENCTLDINDLGAKRIYNTMAAATAVTTTFNKNYTMLFIYNSTRVSGGCWDMYYGYNANTTYTNASLGQGYATCTTAEATIAKTASLSSYSLTTGGYVAVKFSYDVPANSTLNVNSKGAKAMYYRGAAITGGIIKANDVAVFIYSTYYHLVAIDRWGVDLASCATTQYVDNAIASAQVQSDWNETDTTDPSYILNKPTIDASLDANSSNAVRNSEITAELNKRQGKAVYGSTNTSDSNYISPFLASVCIVDDHLDLVISHNTNAYGQLFFNSWNVASSAGLIVSNVILYNNGLLCATLVGYTALNTNTWAFTVYPIQDALTFDSTPTNNSTNPVTSGGVYTALSSKANNADIPSASSTTPLADGTAAVGVSTAYARADHVHPVSSIAALSDTNISSPSVGQALVYDGTSSKWVNASVSASDIGAIPAPQEPSVGQFLTYQQLSQGVYGWGVTDLNAELNNTSAIFYELEPTDVENQFMIRATFSEMLQIFSSTRKAYFVYTDSSTGDVTVFDAIYVNAVFYTVTLVSISTYNIAHINLQADSSTGYMKGLLLTTYLPEQLLELLDVNLNNPSDGQILTYNETSSRWVNSTLTLPSASSSAPLIDGVSAVVGTSTAYARADHVHPKITQTISMSNNVITLTGSDGSTSSVTLPVYDGTVTSGGGS